MNTAETLDVDLLLDGYLPGTPVLWCQQGRGHVIDHEDGRVMVELDTGRIVLAPPGELQVVAPHAARPRPHWLTVLLDDVAEALEADDSGWVLEWDRDKPWVGARAAHPAYGDGGPALVRFDGEEQCSVDYRPRVLVADLLAEMRDLL